MRLAMILGSVFIGAWGVLHLFIPVLGDCRGQLRRVPAFTVDLIYFVNFMASLILIIFGVLGILVTTRLWAEATAVKLVAWPVGPNGWLGIGLGDLLLATVGPLALRKAFGRRAGLAAVTLSVASIAVLLALLDQGLVRVTIPAMVLLGPLTVAQYLVWRRGGRERTTWEYLQAEPPGARAGASATTEAPGPISSS